MRLARSFFLLTALGIMLACDASYFAYIRNEGTEPLTLGYSINGGREVRVTQSLAPGDVKTVGKVGGPGESPRIRVTAYDARGEAVFCRDFSYEEYRLSGPTAPIGIRGGHLDCR